MSLEIFLGLVGALLGIAGLALAYYFYIKTIRTKVLAIAYTQPVSLQLPISGVLENYRHLADEPSRLFMLLWNRGTAPTEKSDFVEPIKISPADRVLKISAHEQDGAAAAAVDDEQKCIQVELLRPGEAIIFLIDATGVDYTPEISVLMKSSDMSVFLPSAPIELRSIIAAIIALGTGALLLAAMFWVGLTGVAVVALALVFWPATSWFYERIKRRLSRLTPFLPYKFFRLQDECSQINRSWADLLKKSRYLMAMG